MYVCMYVFICYVYDLYYAAAPCFPKAWPCSAEAAASASQRLSADPGSSPAARGPPAPDHCHLLRNFLFVMIILTIRQYMLKNYFIIKQPYGIIKTTIFLIRGLRGLQDQAGQVHDWAAAKEVKLRYHSVKKRHYLVCIL